MLVAKDLNVVLVQEHEDEDETLSFSDLPLNSNSSIDLDDFSKEYQSSTFDQDFFEFFSEDFSASSITDPTDNNIIFCGKLIPPKKATEPHLQKTQTPEIFTPKSINTKNNSILPWKSQSFSIPSRPTSSYKTCKSFPVDKVSAGKGSYEVDKCDFLRKSSAAVAGKSRWNLFGRFPMEMELRDMKTRQRKRQAEKIIQCEDRSEEMGKNGRRKKVKNLWGLLRVLVCESHQAKGMVNAPFGISQP